MWWCWVWISQRCSRTHHGCNTGYQIYCIFSRVMAAIAFSKQHTVINFHQESSREGPNWQIQELSPLQIRGPTSLSALVYHNKNFLLGIILQLKHVHNSKTRQDINFPTASKRLILWWPGETSVKRDLLAAGASSGHLILSNALWRRACLKKMPNDKIPRCCNSQHVPQTWYLYALTT